METDTIPITISGLNVEKILVTSKISVKNFGIGELTGNSVIKVLKEYSFRLSSRSFF